MDNIIQTAKKDGSFKMLIKAIDAAGLADTLSSKGPFTVFAPSDEAFMKMSRDKYEKLLTDKNELKKILTYHVLNGKLRSKEVSTMATAKTLEGDNIRINAAHGVMINNAHVTKSDIECSNGEIHVIDHVLMPSK